MTSRLTGALIAMAALLATGLSTGGRIYYLLFYTMLLLLLLSLASVLWVLFTARIEMRGVKPRVERGEALMTIFTVACAPFAIAAGMHPFIPGFIALVTVNVYNTSYNNGTYITAMAAADGMVQYGPTSKMSWVYTLACIVGCICCVPMWKAFGLM